MNSECAHTWCDRILDISRCTFLRYLGALCYDRIIHERVTQPLSSLFRHVFDPTVILRKKSLRLFFFSQRERNPDKALLERKNLRPAQNLSQVIKIKKKITSILILLTSFVN